MKLFISGTGSGLGRHLLETLGGVGWDPLQEPMPPGDREVIIHSAWPPAPPKLADDLAAYTESTIELTRRLLEVPHRKFIFISTCEVYPLRGHSGAEDEPIKLEDVRNLYAYCKLMAEAAVRARARSWLILRMVGLLGPTSRPNSLIRVLRDQPCQLTLTAQSRFYYTLHRDVSAFVRAALDRNLTGIYNVCTSDSITLGEVAQRFARKVRWGGFTYDIARLDNRKIAAIFPILKKTSLQVVEEFLRLGAPTNP